MISPHHNTGEGRAVSLTLPFPVSVNGAFRRHNGAYLSERYRKWRDEAGWTLLSQRPEKIAGPVAVTIDLKAPDRRVRDADNTLKALCDLLVKHGVIEGDDSRFVRSLSVQWVDHGQPRADVTVRAA